MSKRDIVGGLVAVFVMVALYFGFDYMLKKDESSCIQVCQAQGLVPYYKAPKTTTTGGGKLNASSRNTPSICKCYEKPSN